MCLISGTETSWPGIAHSIIIFSFSLQQRGLIATACRERSLAVLISEWCQWIVRQSACWPRSKLCHHLRVQTGECQCLRLFSLLWPQSSRSHVSSSRTNMLHTLAAPKEAWVAWTTYRACMLAQNYQRQAKLSLKLLLLPNLRKPFSSLWGPGIVLEAAWLDTR